MDRRLRIAAALAALTTLLALAACRDPDALAAPNRANFTAALDDYLAKRGHLCVAKYDWPIVVAEADANTPDARQMSYLESIGLAMHSDTRVAHKGADGGAPATLPARSYALTSEGRKYYLHIPVVVATPLQRVTHPADLCVAKLSLDRLFGWEKPQLIGGRMATSLLFSYRIVDPAPWLATADARLAFPMALRAIDNAGVLQLRLGVHLTRDGWVADELSD